MKRRADYLACLARAEALNAQSNEAWADAFQIEHVDAVRAGDTTEADRCADLAKSYRVFAANGRSRADAYARDAAEVRAREVHAQVPA